MDRVTSRAPVEAKNIFEYVSSLPDLKVSVDDVVDVKVIVIVTKWIDENLSNSQPAKVENKLEHSKEGEGKVDDGRRVIAHKVHCSGDGSRGVTHVLVNLLIFLLTRGGVSSPPPMMAIRFVNFNKECWLQKLTVKNSMSPIKVIDY